MAESGKPSKASSKTFGNWAVKNIFSSRNYDPRQGPPRKGTLHSLRLQWSLAGLSDTWHELKQQVCSFIDVALQLGINLHLTLSQLCLHAQAATGSPTIDENAVVTAYLRKHSIDSKDPKGPGAHTNLCGKLVNADWLAALEAHLPQYTATQQGTRKAGM